MITQLRLAQLSEKIYDDASAWDMRWAVDDVVVGMSREPDGTDAYIIRGTANIADVIHDMSAIPTWHPQLGFCHAGFLNGMDDLFAKIRLSVGKKNAISGHSLGGSRARLLAGLFLCNGLPVDMLWTFGSPRPAFVNLARIIQKSGIVHGSDRFGNDIVPDLPFYLPPLFSYVHTEDWQQFAGHSAPDDINPLRDHAVKNYVSARSIG